VYARDHCSRHYRQLLRSGQRLEDKLAFARMLLARYSERENGLPD
jgi:hypothetical protein